MKSFSKVALALALLGVALLTLGCTQTISDKDAYSGLNALEVKYSAVDSLPTQNTQLNDYISALATLRSKSGGSAAKVIDAELFSAQAFYYQNNALLLAAGLDAQNMRCSSKDVKAAIAQIGLAQDSYSKAVAAINSLFGDESTHLRQGTLDAVNSYGDRIKQLKAFFDSKC